MITMKELAKKIGVSQPTVSLVINDRSSNVRISESTREKVLAAAEKYGYKPNTAARIIKGGSFKRIACVQIRIICEDSLEGVYPHQLQYINGMATVAVKNGYSFEIAPVIFDRSKKGSDKLYFPNIFRENAIDGLICLPPGNVPDEIRTKLSEFNIPRVWLNNDDAPPGWSAILADEFKGSEKVTKHLIKKGHREFAWIGYKASNDALPHYSTLQRKAGLTETLKKAGLKPATEFEVERDNLNSEICEIFKKRPNVDAIVMNISRLSIDNIAFFEELEKRGEKAECATFLSEWLAKDFLNKGLCLVTPETRMGELATETIITAVEKKKKGRPKLSPTLVPPSLVLDGKIIG